jgi:hypothetical protein
MQDLRMNLRVSVSGETYLNTVHTVHAFLETYLAQRFMYIHSEISRDGLGSFCGGELRAQVEFRNFLQAEICEVMVCLVAWLRQGSEIGCGGLGATGVPSCYY